MKKILFLLLLSSFTAKCQWMIDGQATYEGVGSDSIMVKYIQTSVTADEYLSINNELFLGGPGASDQAIWFHNTANDSSGVVGKFNGGLEVRGTKNGTNTYQTVSILSGDTSGLIIGTKGEQTIKGKMPNAGGFGKFWTVSDNGTDVTNSTAEVEFDDSVGLAPGAVTAGMALHLRLVFTVDFNNTSPNCTIRLKYVNDNFFTWTFYSATGTSQSGCQLIMDVVTTIISNTSARTSAVINYWDGNTLATYKNQTLLTDVSMSSSFVNGGTLKLSAQWSAASIQHKIRIKQIVASYSDAP